MGTAGRLHDGSTTGLPPVALGLLFRQQLEQAGEERRHDARMRIHAVGVIGGAVSHREHTPSGAHGNGGLEVGPDQLVDPGRADRLLMGRVPIAGRRARR